jgi:hypothetical protein
MQTVELSEQPTPAKNEIKSPTGIVLSTPQKVLGLMLLLGLLYLRLWKRKRSKDRICSHCGHRNPRHRTNCTNCSAPMFLDE